MYFTRTLEVRLFGGKHAEKWERTLGQVDRLRGKMGFDAVRLGKSVEKEAHAKA